MGDLQWKGEMRGDTEGECIFTGGMGGTVIDYIMGSEEIRERIREVKIEDKIDSNHQPIEAVIKGKERWSRRNGEKYRREYGMRRGVSASQKRFIM